MNVHAPHGRSRWICCACLLWAAWLCGLRPCGAQDLNPVPSPGPERRIVKGQTADQAWFEEYWPDGRLAAVRCAVAGKQELLREGHCRYKDYTGALVLYHPDGTVAEVLHLTGGVLDGVVEIYDALGHLQDRLFFRNGAQVSLDDLPPGERLGPAGALPDLPVPPTVDGQVPGPPLPTGEIPGAGPPGRFLPRPPFRPLVAIGLDIPIIYGVNAYTEFTQLGIGLSLLVQVHRRLLLELGGQYAHTVAKGSYDRLDVPLRLGVRVPLFSGALRLSAVANFGAGYARRNVPPAMPPVPDTPDTESAWYAGGDAGIAMSLFGGGRFGTSLDVRLGGRARVDNGPHLLTADTSGNLQEPMAGGFFILTTVTFLWNFGAQPR